MWKEGLLSRESKEGRSNTDLQQHGAMTACIKVSETWHCTMVACASQVCLLNNMDVSTASVP